METTQEKFPLHPMSRFALIVDDENARCIEQAIIFLQDTNYAPSQLHQQLRTMFETRLLPKYKLFTALPNKSHFVTVPIDYKEHLFHQTVGSHFDSWKQVKNETRDLLQRKSVRATIQDEETVLQEMISSWTSVGMPSNLPLWHMICIHGYSKGPVLLWRIHHALGDGLLLASMFADMCEPLKEHREFDETMPMSPNHELAKTCTNKSATWNAIRTCIYLIISVVVSILYWIYLVLWYGLSETKTAVRSGKISKEKRVAWNDSLKFDAVYQTCKQLGVTVNDMMVSCLSSAIYRYCKAHGNNSKIPDNFRFSMPVNLRTSIQIDNPNIDPNQLGFLLCALPLQREATSDPLQRLAQVKKTMDFCKRYPQQYLSEALTRVCSFVPATITRQVFSMTCNMCTAAATNVRGPRNLLGMLGKPVIKLIGTNPNPLGIPISFLVFSYDGRISMSLSSDALNVNQPQQLLQYVVEEFESIGKQGKVKQSAA